MIKVVLLVGFLGAGKTTMMKRILEEFKDQKIGVIVNEFGDVSIDTILIDRDGLQMAELSGGSVFCACIKDKFVESLIEMSYIDMDYLFIEASGLADPANMTTIFKGIEKKILMPYDYRGSICIVDAESFADLYEVLPAITSQLEYSDSVIINKSDLLDEAALDNVKKIILEINPNAAISVTTYCDVGIKEMLASLEPSSEEARDSSNTAESRPQSFIIRPVDAKTVVPYDALSSLLAEIAGGAYRIKGFVATDKGNMEVSCVRGNINITPWVGAMPGTELVLISSIGIKLLSMITQAIEKYAGGMLRL